jgi:tetratricopeptide (TPR) repeat protein
MKRILFIIVVIFVKTLSVYAVDQNLLMDLYTQGNELFQEAIDIEGTNPETARELYKDSLSRFIQISEDIQNGKLYYNIGNIYFQLGDIGNAILAYNKAALFIPGDRNLQENLSIARTLRIDLVEESESTRLLETIFSFHYNISSSKKSILFIILFGIFWTGLIFLLITKGKSLPLFQAVFRGTIIIFLILTILLGSVLIDTFRINNYPDGVILDSELIARKGDGLSYSPSFKDPLHAGLEFILREKRPGWFYIELSDKTRAWIPADSAALVQIVKR